MSSSTSGSARSRPASSAGEKSASLSQRPTNAASKAAPAATVIASLTPQVSAACPQIQLPMASPPATAVWKAARTRPATQRGDIVCTPMLKMVTLRSEEHTSELQSLMRISYAVFCLKKKTYRKINGEHIHEQ